MPFLDMLQKIFDEEGLTPDRLYTMDGSSLRTQHKIIAVRGKTPVGTMTSTERGESTTRNYVSPMLST